MMMQVGVSIHGAGNMRTGDEGDSKMEVPMRKKKERNLAFI